MRHECRSEAGTYHLPRDILGQLEQRRSRALLLCDPDALPDVRRDQTAVHHLTPDAFQSQMLRHYINHMRAIE